MLSLSTVTAVPYNNYCIVQREVSQWCHLHNMEGHRFRADIHSRTTPSSCKQLSSFAAVRNQPEQTPATHSTNHSAVKSITDTVSWHNTRRIAWSTSIRITVLSHSNPERRVSKQANCKATATHGATTNQHPSASSADANHTISTERFYTQSTTRCHL